MPQVRSMVGSGGGQSAAAPNPSQPQLKAVPMIAKMEEAKRRLRMPFQPGGGGAAPPGMRGSGGAMSPGNSGGMPRGVRTMPSGPMDQSVSSPGGVGGPMVPPPAGAEPGGPPSGPQVEGDPYGMLPPRMRESARAAGRDPKEAVASRMANDPIFRQQIIQQFTGGGPGGPPAGAMVMPGGDPTASIGADAPMGPGGPMGAPPPGADIGGPNIGPTPDQAFAKPFQPNPGGPQQRGFNPGSLADLYGQLMPGKTGPPQYGGAGGGRGGQASPPWMGAYRG